MLVLLQFKVEISFICPFFPDIQPRLCDLVFFAFSFSGSTTILSDKQIGFQPFCLVCLNFALPLYFP